MRTVIVISLFLSCCMYGHTQHGVAFQNLRNATFQSSNYNPAYMPAGRVFIGLPVLSGINVYVSNKFSYNELFIREGNELTVDISNAIDNLGKKNLISTHINLSLFHLGIRIKSGAAFSLFVNERIESDFTYPRKLIKWAWEGNADFIGRKIDLGSIGLTTNYFREYGIGLAHRVPDSPLSYGIRLKMYQGVVNMSTPANFDVSVETENENFQLNFENKNTVVRTAGIEVLRDGNNTASYMISNGNKGFGIDLGLDYRINRYYSFSLAATDLGFISWKEGIKNYELKDTTFRYSGADLRQSKDLIQTVQDSLLDRVIDLYNDDNTSKYVSPMVSRLTGSWIFTPVTGLDIITTVSSKLIQYQPKMAYGVGLRGYLGPKLIGSASITKLPQQFFNIGAAFAVSAGPVQLYASADKVLGYSVPNMKWAEFRIGLNFIFGSTRPTEKGLPTSSVGDYTTGAIRDPKGVVTGTFMGDRIKVKRQEGIYTIIKRKEPGYAGTITPYVINNDRKYRRIHSATGSVNTSEGPPTRNQSISGVVNKQSSFPRKIQSATGKTDNRLTGKKRAIRSATGHINKGSKPKIKIRSATGQNRNDRKKKKRNRGGGND